MYLEMFLWIYAFGAFYYSVKYVCDTLEGNTRLGRWLDRRREEAQRKQLGG